MRCWGTALLLVAACSRREVAPRGTADGARSEVATTSSVLSTVPSSTPVVSAADSGAKRDVTPRLVTEPAATAGTWNVVAKAPEISLNAIVTTFANPQLCGVVPILTNGGLPKTNLGKVKAPPAIVITCAGDDPGSGLAIENSTLRIGSSSYPIPADIRLVLPTEIEQPPLADCSAGDAAKSIDAKLIRRSVTSSTDPRTKEFEIDLLFSGERVKLGAAVHSPMSCVTSREFPKTTRVDYSCSYAESGFTVTLRVEPQRLWIEWVKRSYQATVLRARFGRQVPCNSQLRFPTFALRDSGWTAFGSACALACNDGHARCDNPCYERFANEEGELSDAGVRCVEACRQRKEHCDSACVKKGQY